MTNKRIRDLIADTAISRIGKTRQELGYRCEETCAEGVSDVLRTVFNENNLEGLCTSYSCNTLYADMTDSPYWYEPEEWMDSGDIIFFDWDRISEEKPLDHVGICLGIENDMVQYANINGSDHNKWTVQAISKHNVNIAYWLRYINPTPKTNTAEQDTNTVDTYKTIRQLQQERDNIEHKINELILSLCE